MDADQVRLMSGNQRRRPYLDRCPKCLDTLNEPKNTDFSGESATCTYECPGSRCRHAWVTSWRIRAEWELEDRFDEA